LRFRHDHRSVQTVGSPAATPLGLTRSISAGGPTPRLAWARRTSAVRSRTAKRTEGNVIRIATWNCCRASVGKTADACAALDASLTVLQEARRPASLAPGHLWTGIKPHNGLQVVPGQGVMVTLGPVEPAAPWSIIPLTVSQPVELHVLMVWTRKEHAYVQGLDAALSTYAAFLAAAPSVVLGDFNANAIWDNARRPTDFSRVATRLSEQFGLVSAYHAYTGEDFGLESQATHYFWRRRSRPFHIDYCFVPTHWVGGLRNVSILDGPPWDALSDHRPLVVDWSTERAKRT